MLMIFDIKIIYAEVSRFRVLLILILQKIKLKNDC